MKIIPLYKTLNASIYTDWLCKILITVNLIRAHLIDPEIYSDAFPDIVVGITIIALWLYFFKLRLAGILVALFAFALFFVA
jgi:hypothetical protein